MLLAAAWAALFVAPAGAARAQGPCKAPASIDGTPTGAVSPATLGDWYARHGQPECAIAAFRSVPPQQQQSGSLQYALGMAEYKAGHLPEAEAALRRSAELAPEHAEVHLALGVLAHDAGDRPKAMREWTTAVQLQPASEIALDWLSKARIEAGEYDAALDVLRTAPPSEGLSIDRLIASTKAGLFQSGIHDARLALTSHPDWGELRLALATVLVERNQFEEALVLIRAALRATPASLAVQVLYLRVLVLDGSEDDALPFARSCLAQHPDDFDLVYLIGIIERHRGEYEAALPHLERAVAMRPQHYDSRLNLGITLLKLHRLDESKAELQTAASMREASADVHFQLAAALRGLGEREAAQKQMALYQQELATKSRHDELVSLAAQASERFQQGDAAGAAALERTILEKHPDEPVHWYDLALELDQLKDYDGERDALQHAVALRPTFAPAWNALGYMELRAGRDREAQAAFTRAVQLVPDFAEAQSNLGSMYEKAGQLEPAEQHFRAAVQSNPGYVDGWINLAAALAEQSNFAAAREAAQSALRVQPGNADAARLLGMLPDPTPKP